MSSVIVSNLGKLESSYALEIISSLQHYLQYSIQTAPSCPRSGDLYLFASEYATKKDEWKYDNLKWINNSSRLCQRGNFQIKLHYFTVNIGGRNRGMFFKQVYATQVEDLYIALIYYHGSNEHAIKVPHSKLKQIHNNAEVSPTVTYSIPAIQECSELEVNTSPTILIHHEHEQIDNNGSQPRNQFGANLGISESNLKMDNNMRQHSTIALHQKAEQNPNLIYLLTSIPQLTVVFGYNDLIQEFRHLLRTHPFPSEVCLSLDLSFRMESFYVTPVYINYPRFSEDPSFPVVVLLHETRSPQVYNSMFSELVELMPELQNDHFTLIVDNIDLTLNSVKQFLSNLKIHKCETEHSNSRRNANRATMTRILTSTSLDHINLIDIMMAEQKNILEEVSRSYKSKGKYHLQVLESGMIPAACLQNNIYQVLEISSQASQVSIQDIPGLKWHIESSPSQEQDWSAGFSSYVKLEQKSDEDSPSQGSSPVIAEANQYETYISQSLSTDNLIGHTETHQV